MVQGILMAIAILPAAALMIHFLIRAVLVIVVLSAIQVIFVLLQSAIILTAALGEIIMIIQMLQIHAQEVAPAQIVHAVRLL